MKKTTFLALFLLANSSDIIATELKLEDEFSKQGSRRIVPEFKDKILQKIDILWDENQKLWYQNDCLKKEIEEYKIKNQEFSTHISTWRDVPIIIKSIHEDTKNFKQTISRLEEKTENTQDLNENIAVLISKLKEKQERSNHFELINTNLKNKLEESESISRKLGEDIQEQKSYYEREKGELEENNKKLELQIVQLQEDNLNYKRIAENVGKFLTEEEVRREQQIQKFQKGKLGIIKKEKIDLEHSNQQLKRDLEHSNQQFKRDKEELEGELRKKQTLIDDIEKDQQNLLKINTDLQKQNTLLLVNQQENKIREGNSLNLSIRKEQEYLVSLYNTIKKAKINLPKRTESLIEALDMLQVQDENIQ